MFEPLKRKTRRRSALVFGETHLCILCIEHLLNQDWTILAVVSQDQLLHQWSAAHSIPCFDKTTWQAALLEHEAQGFYVFSIINPLKIPSAFLQEKDVVLAINYHDSLLPRYAGTNSTTWAILEGETQHGVSWHCMDETIDAGDLLIQQAFPLLSDMRAVDVNLRCAELAYASFKTMLSALMQGSLSLSPQDVQQRSYFGRNTLPPHYGFIDETNSLQAISTLVRALDFGDYENPVATLKLFYHQRVYLLHQAARTASSVAEWLQASEWRDVYGYPVAGFTEKIALDAFYLSPGDLAFLARVKEQEQGHRRALQALLQPLEHVAMPMKRPSQCVVLQELSTLPAPLLLSFVAHFLSRIFAEEDLLCIYQESLELSENLQNILDKVSFMRVGVSLRDRCASELLAEAQQSLAKPRWLSKDFFYRYRLQRSMRVGLVLGAANTPTHLHAITIYLNQQGLRLYYNEAEKHCIPAFCDALRYLSQDFFPDETKLHSVDIMPPVLKEKILTVWSGQDAPYPQHHLLHHLFEEQAVRTPEAIALVDETQQISYRQLNEQANQLAHCIVAQQGSNQKITLCLERSADMIVALLAVLKAGSAYVPIDPHHPLERIQYILEDTKSSLILMHPEHHHRLASILSPAVKVLLLEENKLAMALSTENLRSQATAQDLAYVIYTSGTTGKPKGVMIRHQGVCNLVHHAAGLFGIDEHSRVLQFAAITFDASVLQIFNALSRGASLYIAPEPVRKDAQALTDYLQDHAISVAGIPAALLSQMDAKAFPFLKTLLVAGESYPSTLLNAWCDGRCVINAYGPTENSIGSSFHYYQAGDANTLIGQPFPNVRIYVLDAGLQCMPVGVEGELYLGGPGLAAGYLNQAELSQARFIDNPYRPGERLYKTGDRVRWLAEGVLDYVGRVDFQIKLRGYRIELAEIEQALLTHAAIKQCVLIAHEANDNVVLVAYYSLKIPCELKALQAHLHAQLPDYMVPGVWLLLETFPMNANGKIDRKALPAPLIKTAYRSPRDALEALLCTLWEKILKQARVGIEDDFFSLGGHSILAMQLAHQSSVALGQTVSVSDIFKQRTISHLAVVLRSQEGIDGIKPALQSEYPLSYGQERLFFIEQYEQGSTAYQVPMLFSLSTDVCLPSLTLALQAVFARHDVLRTVFIPGTKAAYQQVVLSGDLELAHVKIPKSAWAQRLEALLHTPFDLSQDYPLRAWILEQAEDGSRYCLLNFHHVAIDGWSQGVFIKEWLAQYEALLQGQALELPPLGVHYRDFAVWQRDALNARLGELRRYWQTKLADVSTLAFPTDKPRPAMVDYRGELVYFELDAACSQGLQALAAEESVSLYTVLLAGFALLLSRYTGQEDIVLGTPMANRQDAQLASMLGFFVNSVVLRFQLEPEASLQAHLSAVQAELMAAQWHQDLPFEVLLEQLNIDRDISRHPLFQVMFTVQYAEETDDAGGQIKRLATDSYYQVAKFDWTLSLTVSPQGIRGVIQYASSLFHAKTMQRVAMHYQRLLAAMLQGKDKPVGHYPLLTAEERHYLLVEQNATAADFPRDKTLHQCFAEQVLRTPDKIALVFEGEGLSYAALDAQSSQWAEVLAHYRLQNDAQPFCIALCCELSFDLIIGLMAILKAGATYVPLDPKWPWARCQSILAESQSVLLLTQKAKRVDCPKSLVCLCLDEPLPRQKQVPQAVQSSDLAYILYTSGTTGKPKGVMITHQNVLNYADWIGQQDFYRQASRLDLSYNLVFDGSLVVSLVALLQGHTVVLCKEDIKQDPPLYLDHLQQSAIDLLRMTPSYLSALLSTSDEARLREALAGIRCLMLGGEPLQKVLLQKWMHLVPHSQVINHYGPTETTIASAALDVSSFAFDSTWSSVPIGGLVQNTQFYVLDDKLNPVPPGVVGELYIGGAGVAKAYLNQAKLSAEKFLVNPFMAGGRLYKTGDRVRFVAPAFWEYKGRADFQLKIRGHRVELGEIEAVLLQHPAIVEAAVIQSAQQRDTSIVAYYVSKTNIELAALRAYLAEHLPDYMLPQAFVALKSLPLTAQAKLDRKALLRLDVKVNRQVYREPRTALEALICSIWEELLQQKPIGIDDDFFHLGGHSILAMHLAHRISQASQRQLPVAFLFRYKTIAELCAVLEQNEVLAPIPQQPTVSAPLSFAQERLWFIEQLSGGSTAYHVPLVLELESLLHSNDVSFAIDTLLQRHEILRTRFVANAAGIYQQHVDEDVVALQEHSLLAADFSAWFQTIIQTPFDLSREHPSRVYLCTLVDTGARVLAWVFHHVVMDAWSRKLLLNELQHILSKKDEVLAPLPLHYKDFAVWQRNELEHHQTALRHYWLEQLNDAEPLRFPCDFPRPMAVDYRGAVLRFELSAATSLALNDLAKAQGVTLYAVLLSAFAYLLSKYSGQDDLLIGLPIANRQHPQLANLLGFFVNLLPLRLRLSPNAPAWQAIAGVQEALLAAQKHQDLPFENIIAALDLPRDPSRHPLFQILFNAEHEEPRDDSLFKPFAVDGLYPVAKVDMSLSMRIGQQIIHAELHYARALFKPETLQRFLQHYQQLLEHLPLMRDKDDVLTAAEHQRMVYDWNKTTTTSTHQLTVIARFAEQVLKNPQAMALIHEEQILSYRDLDQQSNQFAHYLLQHLDKVRTRDLLLVLCMDRSPEMLIAILAILKMGAAYVPVDPHSPEERIRYFLEDSKSPLMVTQAHWRELLAPLAKLVVWDAAVVALQSTEALPLLSTPHDLAYVMYTSGTTGKPKGVMIEHQAIINFACDNAFIDQSKVEVVAGISSFAFDGSIFDWMIPLLNGASLLLLSDETLQDLSALNAAIIAAKVDTLFITTALFNMLVLAHPQVFAGLKQVFFGGEQVNLARVQQFFALAYDAELIHVYGPTENTVFSTYHRLQPNVQNAPIGRPLSGKTAYVFDEYLNPVPIGVEGELYLGGAGLARAYLNQPTLSAERFIKHPYLPNERLYKTGDRVRWLAEGELDYLGRVDFQVKLRGYRIELAEIEQALSQHPAIKQCLVCVHEEADEKMLVAYYVLKEAIDGSVLNAYLQAHLPDYMIPAAWMALAAFPLTSNAKIDRKALPAPVCREKLRRYCGPRDALEALLCSLWEKVLKQARVGIEDDFFSLGGHSILAMQLAHQSSVALGQTVSVSDIFKQRTISHLAAVLRSQEGIDGIKPALQSEYPLSYGQERLFFIEQYEQGSTAYQVPMLFSLSADVCLPSLTLALQAVFARHDVLRTVFIPGTKTAYQQVVLSGDLELAQVKIPKGDWAQRLEALLHTPFDLSQDYPLRAWILEQVEDGSRYCLLNFHHVAIDGWSQGVFIKEWLAQYEALLQGQALELPPLGVHYRDFAVWQRDALNARLGELRRYWQTKLADVSTLAFPTDKPRPAMVDYRGELVYFELDAACSQGLQVLAAEESVSLYTVLLAGFALLLSRYTGQDDIVLGTPMANRQDAQLASMLGFFVNSVVLRFQLEPEANLQAHLSAVQAELMAAQWHQDLPFEVLLEQLNIDRDVSRHPLFQVMFTVQYAEETDDAGGQIKRLATDSYYQVAKFDWTLSLTVSPQGIRGVIQYASSLFHAKTMQRVAMHYQRLLAAMLQGKDKPVGHYPLLTAEERHYLLDEQNATVADFPRDKTLHQCFAEQVLRTPDKIALVFEGECLSYAALDAQSSQWAEVLAHHRLQNDAQPFCIALCCERSLDLIVGILAILKAGAAYVPLDPQHPYERLQALLDDSQVACVLTQKKFHSYFAHRNVIFMDVQAPGRIETAQDEVIAKNPLAYILYTSGTTGVPKGVMVEHRAVLALMHSLLCEALTQETKGAVWTSVTFDVSVYEIFSVLLRGGELHLLSDELRQDPARLFPWLLQTGINSLYLPPFFVAPLADYLQQISGAIPLRQLLLGVEPIDSDAVRGLLAKNIRLINAYGPTETTVCSVATVIEEEHLQRSILPIGRPLSNERVYVLDAQQELCPIGVIGELYIGGEGLARGYWRRDDLTQERFISTPWDALLYKTGDWVRWLDNGCLEYVGRQDSQIKIRGYRVELNEIQHVLLHYPGVHEAVVLKHERQLPHGQQSDLLAYYVSDTPYSADALREALGKQLPDYMIPLLFIHLPKLPRTAHGKMDYAALPLPVFNVLSNELVAPSNALEQSILNVWQQVLKQQEISVDDDFFHRGGDSILSMQLVSRLRYAGLDLQVKEIFEHRSIKRLAAYLAQRKQALPIEAEQGILSGSFDLLPIQAWFFAQDFPEPGHWNQAFSLRVPVLDTARLAACLPQLAAHHDQLRVCFHQDEHGAWKQSYTVSVDALKLHCLPALSSATSLGFDLQKGPLWQLIYLEGAADGSARLIFQLHHLIVDTVSWRILRDDLQRLYEGQALKAKKTSYRQWQAMVADYPRLHPEELFFWQQQNLHAVPDYSAFAQSHVHTDVINSPSLAGAARAYHADSQDLLLTALLYALNECFGGEQHVISLEGHGRACADPQMDVSETVAWFTVLYPLLLQQGDSVSASLQALKERVRAVPNQGLGFSAFAAREKDLALSPIVFNYFGQQAVDEAGVWAFVAEPVGQSIHPANQQTELIRINARSNTAGLAIQLATRLSKADHQAFLSAFETALLTVKQHCDRCVEQGHFLYTLSDFKAVKSEADLQHRPILHDEDNKHQAFEMTGIQKAYALGRLAQFEVGNIANHVYLEFCFEHLDVARLERALNRLIKHHAELRTVFDIQQLKQRYLAWDETLYFRVPRYHWKSKDEMLALREALSHKVYDIGLYPLFHFCVSVLEDGHVLHISFDLMLLDAQARTRFFADLSHLYQDEHYVLTSPSISFRDYQNHMALLKHSAWYADDKAYWQAKLPQLPLRPKLAMAIEPRSLKQPRFQFSQQRVAPRAWQAFKAQAIEHGLAVSSVLLALYGLVLSRWSEGSEFLITMTLFNRYGIHPEVNELWGDFTSTNLFGFARQTGSALDFFKAIHRGVWDDIGHALYSGLEVQRDLMALHALDPSMAVSPVIFTCLLGEGQDRIQALPYFLQADERRDERYLIGQTSQAWIDLQATERDGGFNSGWLYVEQLFAEGFIDHLNAAYCALIEALAWQDWHLDLPAVPYFGQDLARIEAANATQQAFADHTLLTWFAQQLRQAPQALAVIDAQGEYSYQQLDVHSQQLAHRLQETGVGLGDLVGVLCEKGFDQLASVLGVLKTGAAYLPLHVEWPWGRMAEVLSEGCVQHVLVSERQWQMMQGTALLSQFNMHRIGSLLSTSCQMPWQVPKLEGHHPAYVIFTSGSTGKPKGVSISHHGAINTLQAVNQRFNVQANDVVLALSDLSFDLSVYDLFGLLGAGARIVFPDQSLAKEPRHWAFLIKRYAVSIWNTVPQLMQLLLDHAKDSFDGFPSLRLVLLSGDWVYPSLIAQMYQHLSNQALRISSLGGATEASIWSIWYELCRGEENRTAIPYGYPMPNQGVYVLNAFGEHCAVGIVGEIHLAGEGLALDYWQDPQRTAARFIVHDKLGRLYKTGDQGRWHHSGYIEFLGREDSQMKRNGHRIELDEIAAKLMQLKGVEQGLVVCQEQKLVAYLVLAHEQGQNQEQLKLQNLGLRRDLEDSLVFSTMNEESLYRRLKSYRHFDHDRPWQLPPEQPVARSVQPMLDMIEDDESLRKALGQCLHALSARMLVDKLLPKYLYPSAGSSYAVRTYLHLPTGVYYYHPLNHALQYEKPCEQTSIGFEWRVYKPAIAALYPEDWQRFAAIEAGHMLYEVVREVEALGFEHHLKIADVDEDAEEPFVLQLVLQKQQAPCLPCINTSFLSRQGRAFISKDQHYDLGALSLWAQCSAFGQLLETAQGLLVFEGQAQTADYLAAGFAAQRYIRQWQDDDVAWCPLGVKVYDTAVYALAVGPLRAEDRACAETSIKPAPFQDAVIHALSLQLPCYMLPDHVLILENLPLTANGKVNTRALPMPSGQVEEDILLPRNAIESVLYEVWTQVLNLSQLSIRDDFFRIGGDSIASIHVTSALREKGYQCAVQSLFEYRSIEALAPHVEALDETSLSPDISYVDVSEDLLTRLQAQYLDHEDLIDGG